MRTVRTASFATGVVFIMCCNIIDWYTQTVVSNVKITTGVVFIMYCNIIDWYTQTVVSNVKITTGVVFIMCCNIIDWYTQTVVSNVKINYVIHILNPLKLTAYIEVEYDVEVHTVASDVLQR